MWRAALLRSAGEAFMRADHHAGPMSEWMHHMTEAMQMDENDFVGAHRVLTRSQDAAMAEIQQTLSSSPEVSQAMTALYGALSAYVQAVNLRSRAEGGEPGDLDHAFRIGQSYGVSCVINHLIDDLVDPNEGSMLASLDAFSDSFHDEITAEITSAGLTVELLDAKGEIIP